jgi:O-antigen/teichoic acid export membrane protein
LDAVNQFGYLFATLLLPMFASMIRRNASMQHLVKFSSELLFVIAFITAADCYFFSNNIMHLLYPAKANPYWGQIFGWLMCTFIPMSSIYVFGTLLTAHGSLKLLNIIALGGMFINIGLNLYLIPHYGALGATYATLATQFLAALAHIIVANKTFGFKFEMKAVLKMAGFVVLSIVVLVLVKMVPVDWKINLVLASGICCVIAAATRLVPVDEVLGLIRTRGTS